MQICQTESHVSQYHCCRSITPSGLRLVPPLVWEEAPKLKLPRNELAEPTGVRTSSRSINKSTFSNFLVNPPSRKITRRGLPPLTLSNMQVIPRFCSSLSRVRKTASLELNGKKNPSTLNLKMTRPLSPFFHDREQRSKGRTPFTAAGRFFSLQRFKGTHKKRTNKQTTKKASQ